MQEQENSPRFLSLRRLISNSGAGRLIKTRPVRGGQLMARGGVFAFNCRDQSSR